MNEWKGYNDNKYEELLFMKQSSLADVVEKGLMFKSVGTTTEDLLEWNLESEAYTGKSESGKRKRSIEEEVPRKISWK